MARLGALRRLPLVKLLAIAEIAMLAREHATKLTPEERRRLVELVRRGHGRRRNLAVGEREELERLLSKMEPWALLGEAADKLSPVPLPDRLRRGRWRR